MSEVVIPLPKMFTNETIQKIINAEHTVAHAGKHKTLVIASISATANKWME